MFNRLSIRQKLTAMLMLTSGTVLGARRRRVRDLGFLPLSRRHAERTWRRRRQLVLDNTAAAVTFKDPEAAGETLEMLEIHPHTQIACLYLPSGAVVRLSRLPRCPPTACPAAATPGASRSPAPHVRDRATVARTRHRHDAADRRRSRRASRPDPHAGRPRSRRSSSPAC